MNERRVSGAAAPRKARTGEPPAGKRELKAENIEQTWGRCHDKWCRSQDGHNDCGQRLEMRAWRELAGGPNSPGILTKVEDLTTDTKEPTFPTSGIRLSKDHRQVPERRDRAESIRGKAAAWFLSSESEKAMCTGKGWPVGQDVNSCFSTAGDTHT